MRHTQTNNVNANVILIITYIYALSILIFPINTFFHRQKNFVRNLLFLLSSSVDELRKTLSIYLIIVFFSIFCVKKTQIEYRAKSLRKRKTRIKTSFVKGLYLSFDK